MLEQSSLKKQLLNYHVDFDVAMGKGSGYMREIEKYSGLNREYFDFFKKVYEKNHFLQVKPEQYPKIPKIIHQIWIGNRAIPKILQEYQKTWIEQNPDWEYKLWTNEEVKKYIFASVELKSLFDQPLTLGERVDVLRYDILYQYGGIYADCDCVCLKPFDVFAYSYDFFAGILQPMFATMNPAIFLQNCLIGAKPKHPIIKKLSSLMLENWDELDYQGDEFYTTIKRTFLTLTLAGIAEANQDGNIDIFMPSSYFLPIVPFPILDIMIRGVPDTILGVFKEDLAPYSSFKDHSFSHHYSHKEWAKDIISTMTFKHKGWTLLGLTDWFLLVKSKLFDSKVQRKNARQTFEEFLAR